MSEHLSTEQMRRYHDRRLPFAETLRLNEHLASCAGCHGQYEKLYQLPDKLSPIEVNLSEVADDEPLHLLFEEEILPYVEGRLNGPGREIVESHMGLCARCERNVHNLLEFKGELESSTGSESLPVTTVPGQSRFLSSPLWNLTWVAAAIITLAILVSVVLLRSRIAGEQPQATEHEAANDVQGSQGDDAPATGTAPTPNQPEKQFAAHLEPIVDLKDGGRRITLDKQANLEGLEALPLPSQRAIRAALIAGAITKPEILSQLRGDPGLLRDGQQSGGEPFALLSPAGTVVLDDRPIFRWQALSGATAYIVSVFDADFNRVAKSEMLETTQWQVSQSLRRGAVYSWQVSALMDGKEIRELLALPREPLLNLKDKKEVTSPSKPSPDVRFKIIESAKEAELQRIKKIYPNSHLALGVLYAQAGLRADAEREFLALARANPRAIVAKNLLRSVRAWRRR